jgi:inner membrane protein
MAALPVGLVALVAWRRLPWLRAFAAALLAVFSHQLLDLTNAYGIRLFLPFSNRWASLAQTSVIDLWIWAVLLICVVAPFIGRLVGAEIASSSSGVPRYYGRGFAWFALLFLLVYNYGRSVLHTRAVELADAFRYQDSNPTLAVALPDAVNPLRWRAVVETPDFFAVEDLSLIGDFDPARATVFYKPEASPALDAARRTPAFQGFLEFAQLPMWRVSTLAEPPNATLVQAMDMRFGTPTAPAFVVSAVVDAGNRVLRSEFQYGRLRPR